MTNNEGCAFSLGLLWGVLCGMCIAAYLERHLCCPNERFVDRTRIERPVVTCP